MRKYIHTIVSHTTIPTHTASGERVACALGCAWSLVVWILDTFVVVTAFLAVGVTVVGAVGVSISFNVYLHGLYRVVLIVSATIICLGFWALALLILFHLIDQPLDPLAAALVEKVISAEVRLHSRVAIVRQCKVLT